MFGTIIEALKGIIDLRAKAKEDKKTGLEIKKIERELDEGERIVKPATFDEVKEYDPKVEKIRAQFQPKREEVRSQPPLRGCSLRLFIILCIILALVPLLWVVMKRILR